MATRNLKARVEIDGEKEYKEALSELNQGNRVLASEMKKLQEQYKGNENSTEALTAKGELLERQLLQQKDKVAKLREALANAARQTGESSSTTQNYVIQLNNAETAQMKLEHAIEDNNRALQGEDQTMVGLGDTVDKLAGKLGINLPDGAKKALNGMQGFSGGTVAAMTAAVAAVAGVIEIVKKLHNITLEAAADADELITNSMITGVSTETLQKWEYSANLIDVSSDTLTSALQKLTRQMYEAYTGNAEAAEKFDTLGVSIFNADGTLRDAEDTLYDVMEALSGMTNETERNGLVQDLLGKTMQDLAPIFEQGIDVFKAYGEEAVALGYVLDESQIRKLGQVDDQVQRTQLAYETFQKKLAVEFAPVSEEAMKLFADVVTKAGQALVDTHLIDNLALIIEDVLGIIDAFTSFGDSIPGFVGPIKHLSDQLSLLAFLAAGVADAFQMINGLAPWNWGSGQFKNAFGFGYSSGNASHIQRFNMQQAGTLDEYDAYYGNNATGNDNWRGGLTWVGENGPELVGLPRGSRVYNNQDSQALGGTQVFNISVQNIEQLDEIITWYESRQVRGRMA